MKTKTVAIMIGFLALGAIHAGAQTPDSQPVSPTDKTEIQLPKGAKISGKKIIALSGYEFVKTDGSTANLRRIKTGFISGSFTCECRNSGTCDLVVLPNSINCTANTCSSSCFMTSTIKSVVIAMDKRANRNKGINHSELTAQNATFWF